MPVGHPIKLNDKRMKHLFNGILVVVVLVLAGCQKWIERVKSED